MSLANAAARNVLLTFMRHYEAMAPFWHINAPRTPATAHAVLERVTSTVAIATGLIASGRCVDLAGLDQAAGLLCAQVLDLSPTEALALRPALVALNGSVTALETALQQTRS